MKYFVLIVAMTCALLGATPVAAATSPSPSPSHDDSHPAVMQGAANEVASAYTGALKFDAAPRRAATGQAANSLQREVFGFALASSLSDPTVGYPSWDFSLLSTAAFFGLHINDDGTIATDSGWTVWNSGQLSGLLSAAHAHGTKVVLTIIEQDFSVGTPHMCAALANRSTTVTQTAAQVSAKGVDGVNIDFEGLNGTCPNGQSAQSMMTALAHQLRTALPSGSYLSVDTYAGSAGDPLGFFDVSGLNPYVDSFFVMAYDLEYSNYTRAPTGCSSFCLGPTAPLAGYYYNDTSSASQYSSAVGPSKVILGVPYYGRKSCVSAVTPNAYPTGPVTADTYLSASTESSSPQVQPGSYATHHDANDPTGQERWDTWFNTTLNCTRELYWDDATSLGLKYDLVNSDGLRGVGIWNLNYGGGAPELWNALSAHFVHCTNAGLSPSNPSQPAGSTVSFTASSSVCANPQYAFYVQYPGGTWYLKQGFGGPTFNWDTSGLPPGTYVVHAWVNASGAGHDVIGSATVTLTGCTSASVGPSKVTQPAGSTVNLTAGSGGCPNPTYEFWVQDPSGTWTLKQGFGGSTFAWDTTGLRAGTYTVHAWANQSGAATTLEVYGTSTVTLTDCMSASVSPPTPNQPAGTTVNLTASSSGCFTPRYAFYVQYPGGTWYLKQGFGGPTFNWDTSGLAPGTYTVHAWVNNQGAGHDAIGSSSVTLTGCTSASVAPPSGSAVVGTTVTFTVTASGCPTPVYEFWLQHPDGSWHLMQGFSTTTSWQWDTTGLAKGTYVIHVWTNNQGADTSKYETIGSATYLLR